MSNNNKVFIGLSIFFLVVLFALVSRKSNESTNTISSNVDDSEVAKTEFIQYFPLDDYAKLQPLKPVVIDGKTFNHNGFAFVKRVTFNDYGYQYEYISAQREEHLLTSRITISSKNKDNMLPIFSVYAYYDSALQYVNTFYYQFARWMDYGSFLGNYNDQKNNFEYAESIPFVLHCSIDDTLKNKYPLYIVCYASEFTHLSYSGHAPEMHYPFEKPEKSRLTPFDIDNKKIVLVSRVGLSKPKSH